MGVEELDALPEDDDMLNLWLRGGGGAAAPTHCQITGLAHMTLLFWCLSARQMLQFIQVS